MFESKEKKQEKKEAKLQELMESLGEVISQVRTILLLNPYLAMVTYSNTSF